MGSLPHERKSRVTELTRPEELEAVAPEWERLSDGLDPWLPFSGPVWNRTWWRHFAEDRPSLRDSLCVHALRGAHGELVGIAPLMRTERPARGPLRTRVLQVFGSDPAVTEARRVICRAGLEADVFRAFDGHLSARARDWDFVKWGSVADTQALPDSRNWQREPAPSSFVLDLPTSWAEFKQRCPRNIKESLRKCYNSLKREGHSFEFRAIDSQVELRVALERFFELHRARSAEKGTVIHLDVFSSGRSRAFLREYCSLQAPRGRAIVFQLSIAGQCVATRVAFRSGSSLYLYYSGYLPEWGRFSVMTTLLAEAIQWAIAQGIKTVNLSFGRDVSKTRWRPREISFSELRWLSPSHRGRLVHGLFEGIERARQSERFGRSLRELLRQLGGRSAAWLISSASLASAYDW